MFLANVTQVSQIIQSDPASENQIFKKSREIMHTFFQVRFISEGKSTVVDG